MKILSTESVKISNDLTVSEDLQLSLLASLSKGITIFEFKKQDGSIRRAIGTLNKNLIPNQLDEHKIKLFDELLEIDETKESNYETIKEKYLTIVNTPKKEKTINTNLITYFDLEAKQFRSFNKENLLILYFY